MKSHEYLAERKKSLKQLEAILKKADIASGVSFSVRRGVPDDNEEAEDDATNRPWTTVTAINEENFNLILDILIKETRMSLKFWEDMVRNDIKQMEIELARK